MRLQLVHASEKSAYKFYDQQSGHTSQMQSVLCIRAMVLLLLASCLVLRVSCVSKAIAGFMVFLVGPLVFLGCLAAESGV